MARADTSQRFFVTGLIISLLAHCAVWAVASGFVKINALEDFPSTSASPPLPPTVPEEREKVRLGIDDGRVTSLAWLGFQEATPHQGLAATTDQSAMTPAPGAPGAAPVAEAPKLQPAPPAPPVSSAQLREAAQTLADMGSRLADAVKAMAMPPVPKQTDPSAAASPPRPETPPSATQATGAGGKAGNPGLLSDKEAIATSIASAPTVRLGQVAAAHGLDIQTRAPKWSITTLRTQNPRNPTIRITFGRDGKVVRAEFVSDDLYTYSTGSTEVDEPLLSAVYSWTAKGKRLAELTSSDPKGEVTIVIRILLAE